MKIGNYIRNYRKSIGLSMDNFCINICSVKQLERIEKNICEPSINILNNISKTYNVNFYQYYKSLTYFKDNNSRKICDNILHLIKTSHIEDIIPLCNELDNNPDFDSGSLYTFKCYVKAVLTNNNAQYKETISLCYKGLKNEMPDFNVESISTNSFSEEGYSLLNLLGASYSYLNNKKQALTILKSTITSLETFFYSKDASFYLSESALNNRYISLNCQIARLEYFTNNFTESIELIDKCLYLCGTLNSSSLLGTLYCYKCLNLCELQRFEEAKEALLVSKNMYLSSGKNALYESMCDYIKKKFKEIL